MEEINLNPGRNLKPCPECGGPTYSQPDDLFVRDRVRCDGCGAEYARRDLWQGLR